MDMLSSWLTLESSYESQHLKDSMTVDVPTLPSPESYARQR